MMPDNHAQPMTAETLQRFLVGEFPQTTLQIEAVGEGAARIRQPIGPRHLRPGGTVSGPTLMLVADTAMYMALLGEIGLVPLAVTVSLNINFLRRPVAGHDIIGEARLLKRGRRLAVGEVFIYSGDDPDAVAHAPVTYAIPDAL